MKKLLISVLIAVTGLFFTSAFAEEPAAEDVVESYDHEEYIFPSVKPELELFGGYRYVHLNGSTRADEFEYLHSSWTLGGELRLFKFPHRFHLEFDVKNRKDFFGDVGYAYEDIIVFRGINRTLYHNLDNIHLVDLAPATYPTNPVPALRGPGVDVRDFGEQYGVKTSISNMFLRLKTPSYPLHFYIEGVQVHRDGEQQQRNLGGAAYFNNIVRTSQSRDIDNKAETVTVGTNTHFGPIEVDYSHSVKKFSVDGDDVLVDRYLDAGFFPAASTRVAGKYPHNLIPETETTTDTLKVHTSYTGAIVASATLTKITKENNDSGAEADYFIGSGDVSVIATRDLALFLKYRQTEARVDNPDEVTYADVCRPSLNSLGTYKCEIEESISKRVRTGSLAARYRLTSAIVLRGEFAHESISREAADRWFMPLRSQKNTVSLSSDIRLSKQLKLNLKVSYKDISNPAINIEPNRSTDGRIAVTWTPLPWLTTLASYRLISERRDSMEFVHDEASVEAPGRRKHLKDSFLGSVSLLPVKNLIATLSFFYLHDRQREDLAYQDTVGALFFDTGVTNQSTVRNLSLDLQYMPTKHTTLNAGVSTTESEGKFHPQDLNLLSPVSISSFSELQTRETVYTLGAAIDLKGGFAIGANYKYALFKDLIDNPYDEIRNGEAHIVTLSLTKRW